MLVVGGAAGLAYPQVVRVLIDAGRTKDEVAYDLCKKIARAVEKELSYPGQIKVSVIRETRAVRFAV